MFRMLAIVMCVSILFYSSLSAKIVVPAFVKQKINGKTVKVQQFDMTAKLLEFRPLTIAERVQVWGSTPPKMQNAAEFVAICEFDKFPLFASPDCIVLPANADSIPLHASAKILFHRFQPNLPAPDLDPKRKGGNDVYGVFYRFIIDPKDYPKPEPEMATLTDLALYGDWKLNTDDVGYPPYAQRNELSGRLTFRCQVNSDLSLRCYGVSFDPPDNGDIFLKWATLIGAGQKAPAILTNGKNAVGTKFQAMMTFQLSYAKAP